MLMSGEIQDIALRFYGVQETALEIHEFTE